LNHNLAGGLLDGYYTVCWPAAARAKILKIQIVTIGSSVETAQTGARSCPAEL